ncbi:hypothetical protein [Piscinibacter gummiphilus]|uniref:Uncharacterized protein n=1 Tax=Piscinibacter gummiphilus TaxID=946333 RepID=A0ABZ0D011_9BURK|nr:hypothetical protein [Piscinibacter gummiphilus]WOB10531.1 hypothetical protein RXV79_10815 [Piscinibacter gummiphilus]
MKTSTLDTLIWVLIYGGLLGVGLGLYVQRTESALGTSVLAIGGGVAALGFALIYVRSRMKDDNPSAPEKKAP